MGWVSVPGDTYVNELSHHGIKNQKWGIRRWQNPDGSYTDAGRRRYGIGIRKRLAKRAQEREAEKARTEAMKTMAYSAKQQRAEAQKAAHEAQIEAEKAKKELRAVKRENSRFAGITSKIHEKRAEKQEQVETEKKEQETSRKADAYVKAVQSGNKKQIEKVAKALNNDEYRKAIDRINMKYEMDRAATDAKIAKGRQTVAKMRNAADIMGTGADIWNAGAGIVSAFSGKNIPKINTKYQDPLDTLKKQMEYEIKKEALRTTKATADKAEATARKEILSYKEAKKKYDSEYPEPKASSTESLKEDTTAKKEESSSSEPKWMTDWREKSEKDAAKRSAEKTYSYEPERKITTNVTADDAVKALNALTNGGYTGKIKSSPVTSYKFKVEDLQTPINTIHVSKKAKKLVDEYTIPKSKIYYDPDYNEIMVKEGRRNFDVSKLPKEQQQIFFAMINGLK